MDIPHLDVTGATTASTHRIASIAAAVGSSKLVARRDFRRTTTTSKQNQNDPKSRAGCSTHVRLDLGSRGRNRRISNKKLRISTGSYSAFALRRRGKLRRPVAPACLFLDFHRHRRWRPAPLPSSFDIPWSIFFCSHRTAQEGQFVSYNRSLRSPESMSVPSVASRQGRMKRCDLISLCQIHYLESTNWSPMRAATTLPGKQTFHCGGARSAIKSVNCSHF